MRLLQLLLRLQLQLLLGLVAIMVLQRDLPAARERAARERRRRRMGACLDGAAWGAGTLLSLHARTFSLVSGHISTTCAGISRRSCQGSRSDARSVPRSRSSRLAFSQRCTNDHQNELVLIHK